MFQSTLYLVSISIKFMLWAWYRDSRGVAQLNGVWAQVSGFGIHMLCLLRICDAVCTPLHTLNGNRWTTPDQHCRIESRENADRLFISNLLVCPDKSDVYFIDVVRMRLVVPHSPLSPACSFAFQTWYAWIGVLNVITRHKTSKAHESPSWLYSQEWCLIGQIDYSSLCSLCLWFFDLPGWLRNISAVVLMTAKSSTVYEVLVVACKWWSFLSFVGCIAHHELGGLCCSAWTIHPAGVSYSNCFVSCDPSHNCGIESKSAIWTSQSRFRDTEKFSGFQQIRSSQAHNCRRCMDHFKGEGLQCHTICSRASRRWSHFEKCWWWCNWWIFWPTAPWTRLWLDWWLPDWVSGILILLVDIRAIAQVLRRLRSTIYLPWYCLLREEKQVILFTVAKSVISLDQS